MDSTEYYNKNAADYYEKTIHIDMENYQKHFLEFIPEGGSILDLGCGSGRDSYYFKDLGYNITAMDGSKEMCSLASVHIGEDVLHMSFEEMDFDEVFDGVWANASLLHVSSREMPDILAKINRSLKKDGVLYMSFHYGEFEGVKDERYYTDYRSRDLKELIANIDNFEIIEIKKCDDVREEMDQLWIYALVRKIDKSDEI